MAEIGKTKLDTGWLAARSTEVDLTGVQLTTTHPPSGSDSPWMEAVVPGTGEDQIIDEKLEAQKRIKRWIRGYYSLRARNMERSKMRGLPMGDRDAFPPL